MEEASEKTRINAQNSGKFVDSLIVQWIKRTGGNLNITQQQSEEQAIENPSTQEVKKQRVLQNQEHIIQNLKRKLQESQEANASISACLETELRNREEIQTKLNATWETIDTITEYFNFISESLESFQQHRANLSSLYDNVILKQQETIQQFHLDNAKTKDLEDEIAQLKNKSLFLQERLQETTVEGNKLWKQLENAEYELQVQKKELTNTYEQEKLKLIKEQQSLLKEYESRQQTAETEKCDVAKLAAQLEKKLQIQEEQMQKTLTERNKLEKQLEDIEREFCFEKTTMASAHAEEKKILVEKQQQLLSNYESLQLQLKMLEEDKSNVAEIIAQKDVLLSKLQNESSTYKNELEITVANNNEIISKCEALTTKQTIYENELSTKSKRIQNLEGKVNEIKQRESNLINDINRLEKRLINEADYSKSLESKLSKTQKELKCAQEQSDEEQKTLAKMKTANELDNIELQQKMKTLQREKEEIIKRESTSIKNAEILNENIQAVYNEKLSALKSSHEMQLLDLKKTVDHLNETIDDARKEKSVLNVTLTEVRADNGNLRNDYELLVKRNEELQGRLREATETLQMRSIEDRKQLKDELLTQKQEPPTAPSKRQRRSAKRKYGIHFDPKITEIPEAGHCNVSTSADVIVSDEDDTQQPSSQSVIRAYSTERESQKEQEAEITSAGRKFFSRPVQPRTYNRKRQQNL